MMFYIMAIHLKKYFRSTLVRSKLVLYLRFFFFVSLLYLKGFLKMFHWSKLNYFSKDAYNCKLIICFDSGLEKTVLTIKKLFLLKFLITFDKRTEITSLKYLS